MKNLTAHKTIFLKFFSVLGMVLVILALAGNINSSSAISQHTLDKENGCNYAIDDMIGRYSIKVGGIGMIDEDIGGHVYQGNFNINGVNGAPQKMYLYWTLRKETSDPSIQININGNGLKNIIAGQTFGPAVLYGTSTTYWGYVADITTMAGNINNNNLFTIRKNLGGSIDTEIFGAGILIIHNDTALTENNHIEVKCGFDATFYNNLGITNETKWGEWSNVVCHKFDADSTRTRRIEYYAFMSGTKRKRWNNYRPNALWYITGQGNIPTNITNLNKPNRTPNEGLENITGSIENRDLFDALSGNEWDTINSTVGNPQIDIPKNHNYICFQTQSVNRNVLHPIIQYYGWGSSMQWSMSALSFSQSANISVTPTNTPTATPIPGVTATPTLTPTPTPAPTPIIYYPWVNTIGGNTYSQTFDQTHLSDGQFITNTNAIFNEKEAFLSTDLYLQPIGISIPRTSTRNAQIGDYTDSNSEYKTGISWFNYFNQYLRNTNLPIVRHQLNSSNINTEKTSDFHPTGNINDVIVYTYTGNLSLDVNICNTKSIFLIDGDLFITPNLKTNGYTNGCMFIVSGTTSIQPGDQAGSVNSPSPQTTYDEVHAYFITNSFKTEIDPFQDGLFIRGGVVEIAPNTGTDSMSLNRDLGVIRNKYSPSEIIEYDARYLYIYGDLLTYVYGYNIRESQFIRTLE